MDGGFTNGEYKRYSRHIMLEEVGLAGQRKLKQARILIIGTGGLGSPAAMYLVASGVGKLGLVDFDCVDESNLQRQIVHGTEWIGRSKLLSAEHRLAQINPHTDIVLHETRLHPDNARSIIANYDVIIDGTDNFPTRYLVNDTCVALGKINIYGSIFKFDGQVSVFDAHQGPCYRCLFPNSPPTGSVPNCAEAGVLGVLPGVIGTLQATEALKVVLGIGRPLIGKLLLYDALDAEFTTLAIAKNKRCMACGNPDSEQLPKLDSDYRMSPCPTEANTVQMQEISVSQLQQSRMAGEDLYILDVRTPGEYQIANIGGHLLPLGQLEKKLDELSRVRDKKIVVLCHKGIRSRQAVAILNADGFSQVFNLIGGIHQWALQVDPQMARY